MSLVNKAIEYPLERMSGSVLGYYNLWSYFDTKLKHKLAGAKTHQINSCLDFYDGIGKGVIKHGDKILIKDFFVSEWVPRAAGAFANLVSNSNYSLDSYFKIPTIFNPTSINLKESPFVPAFGSVKFPIEKNKQIILSAFSAREYHVDLGIVISVTSSIYSEYLSKQLNNNAVAASFECYVDLLKIDDSFPKISSAEIPGIKLESLSIPYVILRIFSPIQIKFFVHDTHPRFNAWCLRRREYVEPPIIGIEGSFGGEGRKGYLKTLYGDLVRYDYFHWTVFDNDPKEILMVRNLMDRYSMGMSIKGFELLSKDDIYRLLNEFKIDDEVDLKAYGIKTIDQLTEFDGRLTSSKPLIPFSTNPKFHDSLVNGVMNELVDIENAETGDR
jgi:hypothetical protein